MKPLESFHFQEACQALNIWKSIMINVSHPLPLKNLLVCPNVKLSVKVPSPLFKVIVFMKIITYIYQDNNKIKMEQQPSHIHWLIKYLRAHHQQICHCHFGIIYPHIRSFFISYIGISNDCSECTA
jgi:hypothetical protein